MRIYYEDEFVTLYHGDCREIIPSIVFDVLVTDPPYGINLGATSGAGGGHGLRLEAYDDFVDTYENFIGAVVPALNMALDRAKRGAVFTGPHIHEQRKPDAIGGVFCPAASARHRWGFKSFLPVLLYGTAPDLGNGSKATAIRSTALAEKNGHPVPKPLDWMTWLVGLASIPGETILDPFAGSGTTLRAAKNMNRRSIGVEQSEKYCEISAERLSQNAFILDAPPVLTPARPCPCGEMTINDCAGECGRMERR